MKKKLKTKTYAVSYETVIAEEATVQATNKVEAYKKIKEVLGDSVIVSSIWEINTRNFATIK